MEQAYKEANNKDSREESWESPQPGVVLPLDLKLCE